MIQIVEVINSDRVDKRYYAIMNNGHKIHFGSKYGSAYIDDGDKTKRDKYISRHINNPCQYNSIINLVVSPGLLVLHLMWRTTGMNENIKQLNNLLKDKFERGLYENTLDFDC